MDPLDFLELAWSVQGEGFAFVSSRARGNELTWRDTPVRVPDEDFCIPDPAESDVYFTPNLFSKPRRRNEFALGSRWLYADLDTVDPRSLQDKLRPTAAWESSPGRYQCMWLVQRLEPELHARINKQLTYKVGADRSGWDLSQVLRVPGTFNHKHPGPPVVTLMWFDLEHVTRIRGKGVRTNTATGPLLKVVALGDRRLPTFVRAKLRAQQANGDRSKVMYRLERELLQVGFSKDQVFTLLRGSVWNKFTDEGLSADIHRVAARVGSGR